MVSGEPITGARLASIREAGAEPSTRYGTIESNAIGYGCLAPDHPDDVHLLHDLHAVIQVPDRHASGLPAGGLLISSIDSSTPMVLLNLSLGDAGVMASRRCGCPLEAAGWRTHLHTIRSFEKLTAGGMTFLGTDVIRVLEEVLPGQFGGGPADYQLVEEEGPNGSARLRLLVHPEVGPLDAQAVERAFIGALSNGAGPERVMGLAWRDASARPRRAPGSPHDRVREGPPHPRRPGSSRRGGRRRDRWARARAAGHTVKVISSAGRRRQRSGPHAQP